MRYMSGRRTVGWGDRTGYSANGQRWLNRIYDNAAIGFRQLKLKWHNRNKDRMAPQGVIARVGVDVRRNEATYVAGVKRASR